MPIQKFQLIVHLKIIRLTVVFTILCALRNVKSFTKCTEWVLIYVDPCGIPRTTKEAVDRLLILMSSYNTIQFKPL